MVIFSLKELLVAYPTSDLVGPYGKMVMKHTRLNRDFIFTSWFLKDITFK